MPSNKELTIRAEELAKKLGFEVETEGLSNDKLAALVSDLKAKKKDADTETGADAAEEKALKAGNEAAEKAGKAAYEKSKAKETEAVKKPPFYVMPGKALTSKRGILATMRDAEIKDYAEIKAGDLSGGKDALEAFVTSGYIGTA